MAKLTDILLSELFQKQKSAITMDLLDRYRAAVKQICARKERTEEEEKFVSDFLDCIVDINAVDHPRNQPVASGSKQVEFANVGSNTEEVNNVNKAKELVIHSGAEEVAQTVKLNNLVIEPKKFNGDRVQARRWLDDFERACGVNSWNEPTMAKYFRAYLEGAANDWFAVFLQTQSGPLDWANIRRGFARYYIGKDEDLGLERELKDAIQKNNESSATFISRYARMLLLSDPRICQSKMVNAIRIRLRPELIERLSAHRLTTIEDLNLACSTIEDGLAAGKAAEKLRRDGSNPPSAIPAKNKTNSKKDQNIVCHRCNRAGHRKADCFASKRKDGTLLTDVAPQKPPSSQKKAAVIGDDDSESEEEAPKVITTKHVSASIRVSSARSSSNKAKLPMHSVEVNGKVFMALFDSGSETSLINAESASMNGFVPAGRSTGVYAANSSTITCFGKITVDVSLRLDDVTKTVEQTKLKVAENLCFEVIVGADIMKWMRICLDLEDSVIFFKPEAKNIIVSSQESIPARSMKVVNARVPGNLTGAIQTSPYNMGDNQLLVANIIDTVEDGKISCLVANLDNKPKLLKMGQNLASYEQLPSVSGDGTSVNASLEIGKTEHFMTVGEDLNATQLDDLNKLLASNVEAFSINGELGCTSALEHDIELLDGAKPFAEPLRRRPVSHQEETSRQVAEMLNKGVIEPSQSPWAAAYVLAKKKSGEMRLCVDFRRLNDVTKKCVYPLPNIDDCVETLAGKRFFSQLDMASGFWQLPLSKRARELTSFRTEEGQWQFLRMPFGLVNAPASFQRLVNVTFSGLKGLSLQMFIDDLCIASATWQEHLQMLDQVFKLLIKSGLKLKVNKCLLGVSKVTFLGHEISSDGIRQDPKKLSALRDMPEPKSVKELKSALGMLNYYRKFIPRFAIIAEPMTRLLKQKIPWTWGPEQQSAFQAIVKQLLENGTLCHFDRRAPTAVKTDACKVGIASILLQQHEGEWKIVTCKSRRLKPNEANWGVTEMEALGVVEAVTKLRNYLLGIRFKIITDHCALCAVFKKESTNSRLNRWRLVSQEFSFDVIYTKGSMHADVDCLSRAPIDDEVDDFFEDKLLAIHRKPLVASTTTTLVSPLKPDEWRSLLTKDNEYQQLSTQAKHRRNGFKLFNGFLYKDNRLYVPQPKRNEIVQSAHAGPSAGHGGIESTLDKLDVFWWPKLRADVTQFVESCLICQKRKTPRQRPSGVMHSFEAESPMDLVSVDCLDLAESLNKRRHVIVAVDAFTRFVRAKAIKALKGSVFANFLQDYIGLFGAPKTLLTDGAPIFCNRQVTDLVDQFKITHRQSTPHHHEGNAIAERMIQTLQEKLSMLVANSPEEWDMFIGQASLSINSSICSSTGFSPYELMFGRKYNHTVDFQLHDKALEAYVEARRKFLDDASQSASVCQAKSRAASKARFDEAHAPRSFEVGSSVMIREMGRLAKLSNRWNGPFIVVERKSEDIYLIKVKNKTLERHVNDMKPFKHSVVASIVISTLINLSNQLVNFERVPPVLWQEEDKYTSPGPKRIIIRLAFGSPCPLLRQLGDNPAFTSEIPVASNRCEQTFKDNILDRLAHFADGQLVPTLQIGRPPVQSTMANHRGRQGPTGGFQSRQVASLEPHQLDKRDLGTSIAVATYAIVSNILGSMIERVWPSAAQQELQEHDNQLLAGLNHLTNSLNKTQVALEAVQTAVINQATLIHHNAAEIENIKYSHAELMVTSAHIMAKVVVTGSNLDRLRIAIRSRKLDTDLVTLVTGVNVMDGMGQDSIIPSSIRAHSPRAGLLDLEFVARIVDPFTKIYFVEPFQFWTNLTDEKSTLLKYEGPRYLAYNTTNRCVKGIGEPRQRWVNVRCSEPGFEDEALAKWTKVMTAEDPWQVILGSSVKESWPFVYVYCFPHQITVQMETVECPPYVFRANATQGFVTSDGHIYSPEASEIVANVDIVVSSQIHSIHFNNISQAINETSIIKEIKATRREMRSTQDKLYVLQFRGGGGFSYAQLVPIILVLSGGLIIGICVYKEQRRSIARHQDLRRTIVDEQYSRNVYETIHRRSPPSQPNNSVINLINQTLPAASRQPSGSGALTGEMLSGVGGNRPALHQSAV